MVLTKMKETESVSVAAKFNSSQTQPNTKDVGSILGLNMLRLARGQHTCSMLRTSARCGERTAPMNEVRHRHLSCSTQHML